VLPKCLDVLVPNCPVSIRYGIILMFIVCSIADIKSQFNVPRCIPETEKIFRKQELTTKKPITDIDSCQESMESVLGENKSL